MMTRNWPIACAIAVASIVMPTIARATWLDDLNHHLSGDSAVPTQSFTVMNYGTGDGLTVEQSAALHHVAFPQSYTAMVSRFGYPDARDNRADYYDMANGHRVAVVYSDRAAIAVEGL
jgi:hypothetical protein